MFKLGLALAAVALCACSPRIPASNPEYGVGFGDYDEYRNYRNAAPPPPSTTTLPNTTATTRSTDTPVVTNPPATAADPANNVDAALLKAQNSAIVDVKPTAVPTRNGDEGPGIVEFALATSHGVGTKMYRRGVLAGEARAQRNCAAYSSAELAQEAFLEAGGPEKDKLKLDPDGDGYACAWDPTPFRRISG